MLESLRLGRKQFRWSFLRLYSKYLWKFVVVVKLSKCLIQASVCVCDVELVTGTLGSHTFDGELGYHNVLELSIFRFCVYACTVLDQAISSMCIVI